MHQKDIKSGAFYFHTKCHYVYLGTNDNNLIDICSGTKLLPPEDGRINPKYYNHFRPALQDEILRALNKNDNFHVMKVQSVKEITLQERTNKQK